MTACERVGRSVGRSYFASILVAEAVRVRQLFVLGIQEVKKNVLQNNKNVCVSNVCTIFKQQQMYSLNLIIFSAWRWLFLLRPRQLLLKWLQRIILPPTTARIITLIKNEKVVTKKVQGQHTFSCRSLLAVSIASRKFNSCTACRQRPHIYCIYIYITSKTL